MKRSVLALIGSLIGSMFLIYLGVTLWQTASPQMLKLQVAGYQIKVAVLLPMLLHVALAALLNWIAFGAKSKGAALAAAILYSGAVMYDAMLFAIPLALALLALADLALPLARNRKAGPATAAEDPATDLLDDALPGEEALDMDETLEPLADDADLDADLPDADDFDMPEGLNAADGDLDETLDLSSDDPQPMSTHTDGMNLFLGVFMALIALSLAGIVIYGLTGGTLPFMP